MNVDYVQIHVTKLAELSGGQVQKNVMNRARGDDKKWVGFIDGFYLTQGHYSCFSYFACYCYESSLDEERFRAQLGGQN